MDSPIGWPDRRGFLAGVAASAAFFAAHGCGVSGNPVLGSGADDRKSGPRILSLELLTAAPLAELKEFYRKTLGLRVLEEKTDRLTIGAGETPVTFLPAGPKDGRPFYHFAFNIPENKIVAARDWQAKRTPLLPIPKRLRDPKYPEDVVDYNHWNAHSVFFFDPAGNVVEYIDRHDLKNAAKGDFSVADILYASEIGFIVDDVPAMATKLKESVGVDTYRGASDQFTALGDEQGLLLVMKRGRVISFDSPERKAVEVFRTRAHVRGTKPMKLAVPKYGYEIFTEI
jgi:hypothetical protein